MPRWYDEEQFDAIKSSIAFLKCQPDEILSIVAEGVMAVAQREFGSREMKALGVDKVLALHKSKNKLRDEDKNKHLHQVVNHLTVLSNPKRILLGKHMQQLCGLLRDYVASCDDEQREYRPEEVSQMVEAYVKEGGAKAELFLDTLKRQFLGKVKPVPTIVQLGTTSSDLCIGVKPRMAKLNQPVG